MLFVDAPMKRLRYPFRGAQISAALSERFELYASGDLLGGEQDRISALQRRIDHFGIADHNRADRLIQLDQRHIARIQPYWIGRCRGLNGDVREHQAQQQ